RRSMWAAMPTTLPSARTRCAIGLIGRVWAWTEMLVSQIPPGYPAVMKLPILVAIGFICLVPARLLAWNDTGHMTVALIAYRQRDHAPRAAGAEHRDRARRRDEAIAIGRHQDRGQSGRPGVARAPVRRRAAAIARMLDGFDAVSHRRQGRERAGRPRQRQCHAS